METLVKPNTIYAGIGSDLREVLKKMQKEQHYEKLSSVKTLNTWFVDPAISKDIRMTHIEREPLETFIRKKILLDHTFFNNATIISDRMIEHIDVQELSLILLPMLSALIFECKTRVSLTFPDMERILTKLDKKYTNMFDHQLCNIEAIAFGDHKTILSKTRFRNMASKEYTGFDISIDYSDSNMDNKDFYTHAYLYTEITEPQFTSDLSAVELNLISLPKDAREFSYKLNERIEEKLMIREASYCSMLDDPKGKELIENLNYCIKYVDIDKLTRLCKLGYTAYQYQHVYDNDTLKEMIIKEGHFETLPHPSIDLLNKIDPLYSWYSFKKVI